MSRVGASVEQAYKTRCGRMFIGKIEDALQHTAVKNVRGKVQLLLTSPPFPLVRKKEYGNADGQAYVRWLAELAPRLADLLTDNGSIVLEIGNAWERSIPAMSTLPLEALLAFKKRRVSTSASMRFATIQARLPSPAAWVNVDRIRRGHLHSRLVDVAYLSRRRQSACCRAL